MSHKISCLQMTSVDNISTNLATAETLLAKAANDGAAIAVLPEMFPTLSVENGHIEAREPLGMGPIQDFLKTQAIEKNIWIIAGTIPIASEDDTRVWASCLVYNHQGEVVARYDKIHLCDVKLKSGEENYHESAKTIAGNKPVVFESPVGMIGLAVCYDLRFAELFRQLTDMGAEIFVVPSAFLSTTGAAHWEVLCRARAIENQAYLVAANQTGTHPTGRKSYGHSMIINPWGDIVSELPGTTGIISHDIAIEQVQDIRRSVPVQQHRRL